MKRLDVAELPVVIGEEVVGMVTDRDIVIRSTANGLDPKVGKVVDTMAEGVIACKQEDQLEKVAKAMGFTRCAGYRCSTGMAK